MNDMKELLGKLSSYNIFNYLLPGVVFAVAANSLTKYQLLQSDIVTGAFLYYLIGLIISRLGSLVIEPLLKKIYFLDFAPYDDYVAATKKDEKIEILSEANNMYRTFSSLFIVLLLLKLYEHVEKFYPFLESARTITLIVCLIILFLASYRKQTHYITKRVRMNNIP